jgi:hypothetical protein
MRNALLKSLDLACLQPKSCDLTNGKASLKFDALVGDRQVIADERFGVSRFVFKRRYAFCWATAAYANAPPTIIAPVDCTEGGASARRGEVQAITPQGRV